MGSRWPSVNAPKMLRLLQKLGYVITRQNGSHRYLQAEGHGVIIFAFHDSATIAPHIVRKILIRDVGLTIDEAWEVLKHV
ncbi:hypothetical protein Lfu02_57850 [Longispora fulva]|uniref:Putative RNA binding protein YcfA (HicA-like mRNA interferase family) n=1 Tax=Longispora fulva TaxID=619741 RepID=A0A8J7GR11_9ACTN|nr:type II toxin-antitoxin system HicA family toxin [Longispora fulva]MBG6137234.1 putative RNA binding protein YcfA (HicA-like mRNA interferase family) [Longispora fulva]GIG61413.1 hypothetical protein Lfu02_57850 [Longispora fulva]